MSRHLGRKVLSICFCPRCRDICAETPECVAFDHGVNFPGQCYIRFLDAQTVDSVARPLSKFSGREKRRSKVCQSNCTITRSSVHPTSTGGENTGVCCRKETVASNPPILPIAVSNHSTPAPVALYFFNLTAGQTHVPSSDPSGTGPTLQFYEGLLARASSGEDLRTAEIHGREVKALKFKGDGYLAGDAAQLPSGASPRTLAGWFKPTWPTPPAPTAILGTGPFGWGSSSKTNRAYFLNCGRNGKSLWLDQRNNGNDEGKVNPIIEDGNLKRQWYYVAVTWNGTENAAYVDGVFRSAAVPKRAPATRADSNAPLVVGGSAFVGCRHLDTVRK